MDKCRYCRSNPCKMSCMGCWAVDMAINDQLVPEMTMSIHPLHDYVQAVFDQRWATVDYLRCMLPDVDLDECMVAPRYDRERFSCAGSIVTIEDVLLV